MHLTLTLSFSYFLFVFFSLLRDRRRRDGEEKRRYLSARGAGMLSIKFPIIPFRLMTLMKNSPMRHVVSVHFLQGPKFVAYNYLDNLFIC